MKIIHRSSHLIQVVQVRVLPEPLMIASLICGDTPWERDDVSF